MTKTEAQHTLRVGAFVAAGLIVLVISVFLIGGDRLFFRPTETLYVEFKQAQGLAAGSVVSIAGLPAGNVKEIGLAQGRNVVVAELNIEKKLFSRLTDRSEISVKTQGALGDKYIYIDPGPEGGKSLNPGATLTSDLQPDLLEMLSTKTSEVSGSAVDVISELSTLLKELNANNRSASLMENLVGTSKNLNRLTNEPELREAIIHLRNIMRKIDRGEGTLGALINDPTLHDRLVGFLGDSPRNRYLVPLIRESIKSLESSGASVDSAKAKR